MKKTVTRRMEKIKLDELVCCRVDKSTYADLKSLAEKEGKTMAAFLRGLIDERIWGVGV